MGVALLAATAIAGDLMRPPPGSSPDLGAPLYLVFGGTLAGIAIAGLLAWWLLSPLHSVYRRGGLALVSAFASFMIATVVCFLINEALGRPGLAGVVAISLALSLFLARRARIAGTAP